MKYPTLEQVETATKDELEKWFHLLPAPGSKLDVNFDFILQMNKQMEILDNISVRLKELRGIYQDKE